MKKILFAFLLIPFCVFSQNQLSIIPAPVSVEMHQGNFYLSSLTEIFADSPSQLSNAELFISFLKANFDLNIKITNKESGKNIISLFSDSSKKESYQLNIDKNRIRISGDDAGVFYGLQSLIQLLNNPHKQGFKIQSANILDYPRYQWRGMHLDVCRHFFPKEFVKKYIDLLALHKMNTFHWHLTEDQGWRIEIKKYPKLTQIGAYRKGSMVGAYSEQKFDTLTYGGFYTQEDIKEVVQYATERHITIVPEIEMPGHALAALAAYPEYSCTGGPFKVEKYWGVFDDIFCPKEETFEFLENILSEVMELFPGKYIHIGGDEAPKTRWKNCAHCQALIKKENLKDEHELQSYFVQRIEKFVNSKGRQIIGWDEILEGGLAPNAAVMSWRGTEGGIAAANQKHFAVMCPGSHCYFDQYQGNPKNEPITIGGYTTVEKTYSYEPTPDELSEDSKKYILGAQGNVWTEYITTSDHVEYMALPRLSALSEILWSPKKMRNYQDFTHRLQFQFKLFDRLKYNYSKAIYEVSFVQNPEFKNGLEVGLSGNTDLGNIHFSLSGAPLTPNSFRHRKSLILNKTTTIKTALFKHGVQLGKISEQTFFVTKATGKTITLSDQPSQYFSGNGVFTLTDGIKASLPRINSEWLGYSGKDFDAIVNLEKPTDIEKVTIGYLDDNINEIYLPKLVEIFISDDGVNYKSVKTADAIEIQKSNRELTVSFGKLKTKFVRILAENSGLIPEGNPGAGKNSWLFIDEIGIE